MFLHNRINKEELKKRLMEEPFKRKTISFYRYHYLENPQEFRNSIYSDWFPLENCLTLSGASHADKSAAHKPVNVYRLDSVN